MPHRGYDVLDDPETGGEALLGDAPGSSSSGMGAAGVSGVARGTPRPLPFGLPSLPSLNLGPPGTEEPVLHAAVEAFAADSAHANPVVDSGDLPFRALAQGLSMLSLDELRRLRLPAMPWQASDGPTLWEGLKKTPWKAHYTNAMAFVISTFALIAHLWASIVACLLIVFVPQACIYPLDDEKHDCHMNETMNNLNFLGQLVVAFNWISLSACLAAEFVFFRREAWLISHLDDNDAAPYNQLPTFIGEHAKLLAGLRGHNKLARGTALAVLLLCSCNLLFSCALLLTPTERGGRFNGLRTLVGLVSNTLLLARRVANNARISNLSSREDLGLSLFQMKFRSFNDLDAKRKAALTEAKGAHNARPLTPLELNSPFVQGLLSSGSDGCLPGKSSSASGAAGGSRPGGAVAPAGGADGGARHSRSRSEGVPDAAAWAPPRVVTGGGHALSPQRARPPPSMPRVSDAV